MCWIANYGDTWRYILGYNCTCTHYGVVTNVYARQDDRAKADECTLSHCHLTGQSGTRCNMHAIADETIVIHRRCSIHDHAASESRVSTHCCLRHDLASLSDLSVGRDKCSPMSHRQQT